MTRLRRLTALSLAAAAIAGFPACGEDDVGREAEKVGKEAEKAGEEAAREAEKAKEDVDGQ